MKLLVKLKPYAKAAMAALGVVLTVLSAFLVPGTTPALIVSAIIAALTVAGVYRVPNVPALPAAVAALKAAQASRKPATPTTPGGRA